jgi:hypothetical protein
MPADANKARAFMEDLEKKGLFDSTYDFPENSRIWKFLKDSSALAPPKPRLDYCNDVAQSMADERFCVDIEATLQRQESEKAMAAIRTKLSADEIVIWDKMLQAFSDYEDAEGERAEELYEGGTMAPEAYDEQEIYVRKNFWQFVQSTFGEMSLTSSTQNEFIKAEADLKAAYDADVEESDKDYVAAEGEAKTETDESVRHGYEMDAQAAMDYKKDAIASQRAWLVFRNLGADLVAIVYKNKQSGVDWVISAKRELARIRIQEIKDARSR